MIERCRNLENLLLCFTSLKDSPFPFPLRTTNSPFDKRSCLKKSNPSLSVWMSVWHISILTSHNHLPDSKQLSNRYISSPAFILTKIPNFYYPQLLKRFCLDQFFYPKMDIEWTPKSALPKVLYRVVNPNSACKFNERSGFTAANTTLRINASDRGASQLDLFYRSIENHRSGKKFDSPYISVFADRMEAESWTLAAEALFGEGCYMADIDTNHYYLRGKAMWCVRDIQDKSLKSSAQVAANRNLPARGLCNAPRNSEWLVLHTIAGLAVMSQTTPDQIRSSKSCILSLEKGKGKSRAKRYYCLQSVELHRLMMMMMMKSPRLYHRTIRTR